MSSYPRSGSSLLQQLINYAFQKPWSGVDLPEKPLPEITGVPEYFENWRYRGHPWQQKSLLQKLVGKINKLFLKHYNLNDWLAYYDLAIPPYTKNCQYLLPGCFNVLNRKNRKTLAESDDVFVIKTHYSPYESYFRGEYVIQMTRHPGPTFLSYQKLLCNRGQALTLEDVIRGKVRYGAWNHWHQQWRKIGRSLGNRFVSLKYEEVLHDKLMACQVIQSATQLNYDPAGIAQMPAFEDLQMKVPHYYGVGRNEGWESKYTSFQHALFYDLHHEQLLSLGYQ